MDNKASKHLDHSAERIVLSPRPRPLNIFLHIAISGSILVVISTLLWALFSQRIHGLSPFIFMGAAIGTLTWLAILCNPLSLFVPLFMGFVTKLELDHTHGTLAFRSPLRTTQSVHKSDCLFWEIKKPNPGLFPYFPFKPAKIFIQLKGQKPLIISELHIPIDQFSSIFGPPAEKHT